MSSLIVKVCKIYKIEKHPNADRLSIVTIDNENGWNCVVGLDQYKVGSLVVFVPPDCVIPNNLIEKYNLEYLKKEGRTGSVKLRGSISQGLILDVPEGKFKQGDDVAGVLNITKYEVPEPSYSLNSNKKQVSKKKLNPYFDKYTEIENIKNYNEIFKEGDSVVIMCKVHGTNGRFGLLPIEISKKQPFFMIISLLFKKYILKQTHQFCYGSHNVQLGNHNKGNFYGDDVWGKIAKKYDLANKIPKDWIIYGEIYGKGVQDMEYGMKDKDILIFDIKANGKYMDWKDVKSFCEKVGLNYVPELYVGKYYDGILNDYTSGKSVLCPTQIREGIVIKCLEESNHPSIGRKILKSISPEYLIRKGGTEYK